VLNRTGSVAVIAVIGIGTRGFGERYSPKAEYETGGLAGWRDGESRLGLLKR